MAARLATICATDIRNADPFSLRLRHWSRKTENTVDLPARDEDDDLVMDPEDVMSTDIVVQGMIESGLKMFGRTNLERHIGIAMETKSCQLTWNRQSGCRQGREEPTLISYGKVVHLAVPRGTANEEIHMTAHNITE